MFCRPDQYAGAAGGMTKNYRRTSLNRFLIKKSPAPQVPGIVQVVFKSSLFASYQLNFYYEVIVDGFVANVFEE